MTVEQALKMIKAKLKCMERDNGSDTQCNNRECDSCDLCYEQGTCGEHKEALKVIIETLEKMKWIPVSEGLPEKYKRVIVSDVFGIYIGEFIDAEEKWGGKHFINEHGMHSKSVTAWMSLPQPYKAESEEEE